VSEDYLFAEPTPLPLTPGPRQSDNKDGSKQRQKLLSAALYETAERGISNVQVAHIVRRAKVSSRSFYEHFANKEEVLLAVFDDGSRALDSTMSRALAFFSEPCVRLRGGVAAATQFFTRNPPLTRLMLVDLPAIGSAGIDRRSWLVRTWAVRLRAEVSSARASDPDLADAVDGFSDSLSVAVVSGVEGLFRSWLDSGDARTDVLHEGLALVLSAIAREPRIAAAELLSKADADADAWPITGK
jgi:AcrR family transcriptional regulator